MKKSKIMEYSVICKIRILYYLEKKSLLNGNYMLIPVDLSLI